MRTRDAGKAAGQLALVLSGIIVGGAATYLLARSHWRRVVEDSAPAPLRFEEVSTSQAPPPADEPGPEESAAAAESPEDADLAALAGKTIEEQYDVAVRFLKKQDWPRAARVVEEIAKHGRDAVPFLERLLRETTTAQIVVCIVEAIAGIADDSSVTSLLSVLRDDDLAHAHKSACAALEKLEDARIVPAMLELVKTKNETGEVEPFHVELLARKGGRETAEFFVEVLKDPTYDDVAGTVAVNLAEFKGGEDLVQPLFELLHGMDFSGRSFTATSLAHELADIPDARVGRGLTTLLVDETASLDNKQAIAEGAVLSGDMGALQEMLDIARFSEDRQVRCRALLALRLAGDEGNDKPGTAAYREAIAGVLMDMLRDADEIARASACFSLGGVGDERAISLLEHRVALDSSAVVRREAKRALQAIRKRQKAETLK